MSDCYWSLFNQRDKSRFDGLRTVQARAIVKSIAADQVAYWIAWREGTPDWVPLANYQELFIVPGDLDEFTASHVNIGGEAAQPPPGATAVTQMTHLTKTMSATAPDFSFSDESEFNRGQIDEVSHADIESETGGTRTQSFQHLDKRKMPEPKPVTKVAPTGRASGADGVFVIEDDGVALETDADEGSFKTDLRKSTRYRRKLDAIVEYAGAQPYKTKTLDLSLGGVKLEKGIPLTFNKKHVKIILSKGKDRLEAICEVIPEEGNTTYDRFRFVDINRIDLLRSWLLQPGL